MHNNNMHVFIWRLQVAIVYIAFVEIFGLFIGTVSPYRQPAVLNLASVSDVSCEFLPPRVWIATTTSDHRNDFEFLC